MPRKKPELQYRFRKKPELQYRFRVTCETVPEQVGPLLAELARRGITKVGYEVVTDVLRYKRNKPAKPTTKPPAKKKKSARAERYDVSNYDLVTQFAKRQKGQFNLGQVKKMMEAKGRPESSASPVCQRLIERKILRRFEDGVFSLTPKAKLNGAEAVAHV
jgi:hypothetical protein